MTVPFPSTQAKRPAILHTHLGLKGRDRQEFDVAAWADAPEGYPGADVKGMVTFALRPLRGRRTPPRALGSHGHKL